MQGKNVILVCEFSVLSFVDQFLVDKEKVGMFVVRSIVCLQIVILEIEEAMLIRITFLFL